MYAELYLDILFVENLLVNYYLLRLTALLLSSSATRRRAFLAAVLQAGICVFGVCLCRLGRPAAAFWFGFFTTAGIIRLGCRIRTRRELFAGFLCLVFVSFLLEGILRLFLCLFSREGVPGYLLSASAGYGILYGMILLKKKLEQRASRSVTVQLVQNGKQKTVKGLYDTGNALRDTTTGKPVSVISCEKMMELFPDEMREGIADLMEHRIPQCPENLKDLQPRYISFRGVESSGVLLVIRISEMILIRGNTKKCICGPLIALTGQHSSSPRGYEIILHPDLMDR